MVIYCIVCHKQLHNYEIFGTLVCIIGCTFLLLDSKALGFEQVKPGMTVNIFALITSIFSTLYIIVRTDDIF
jgi:type III secretory pathway component EscR